MMDFGNGHASANEPTAQIIFIEKEPGVFNQMIFILSGGPKQGCHDFGPCTLDDCDENLAKAIAYAKECGVGEVEVVTAAERMRRGRPAK